MFKMMYICRKSFLDYPDISLLAKSEVHKLPKILQPLGCECKIKNHFTNNYDRQVCHNYQPIG